MFEDVGNKLKIFGKSLGWLGMTASILSSILNVIWFFYYDPKESINIVYLVRAFSWITLGLFGSWLFGLLVVGLGTLVEACEDSSLNSHLTNNTISNIYTFLLKSKIPPVEKHHTATPNTSVTPIVETPPQLAVCKKCNSANLATRDTCWNCDSKL